MHQMAFAPTVRTLSCIFPGCRVAAFEDGSEGEEVAFVVFDNRSYVYPYFWVGDLNRLSWGN